MSRLQLSMAPPRPLLILAWSRWRRAHQAAAQAFHYGRQLNLPKLQL